jgi:23S rRNA maturation-related 3'-5' exoribonuclease YhaM
MAKKAEIAKMVDDDVYHIGASIKDLGKCWCAFTQMRDFAAKDLLNKIK